MKRNNTEQVGEVLRRLLRQEGLETPLNEYRLVDAWKDVVGEAIARYTTNIYIKNQVLFVHLSSSVLRQELMMSRQVLIRNLNSQVGAYLKISEGCDRKCSYCAIPIITGKHVSRPMEEILDEVRLLVSEAVKDSGYCSGINLLWRRFV